MALISKRIISRLYQYAHIMSLFLYLSLLARWFLLLPLVGSKFLPGGIHEFLCYILVGTSIVELFWKFWFHGIVASFSSVAILKYLNLLYIVVSLHFYDDYEHAPILKNASYSSFIIGLAFTQMYYHWCQLFKTDPKQNSKRTTFWKVNSYFMLPLFYLSEFYLLLLNVQNYNFHTTPVLDVVNKVVLILFFPVTISVFIQYLSKTK